MNTSILKRKIKEAIQHEESSNSLAKLIMKTAQHNGQHTSLKAGKEVSNFVKEYINLVPFYIGEGLNASSQLGIRGEMEKILKELEQYWILEEDLIPDYHGLIGITDDAYASLYLLQTLSDYCRQTFSRALLQKDLTQLNQTIRNILGNNVATALEQKVHITISSNMMSQMYNQVFQNILNTNFAFSNPYQGFTNQYEIDQQVNTQLGAMGIF